MVGLEKLVARQGMVQGWHPEQLIKKFWFKIPEIVMRGGWPVGSGGDLRK